MAEAEAECGGENREGFILDLTGRFAMGIDSPVSISSPADDAQRVVDEMDFFSQEKSWASRPEQEVNVPNLCIMKEDLTINTALHLHSMTEHSTVDDDISVTVQKNEEEKREMAAMKARMERMKEENQRLRNTLIQLNCNYNSLQMEFIAAMQQDSNRNGSSALCHEAIDDNMVLRKQEEREAIAARQFIDLGLGLMAPAKVDEGSSSERASHKRRSISPASDLKEAANYHDYVLMKTRCTDDGGKEIDHLDHERCDGRSGRGMVRELSAEGGWRPNQAAKLSSTSNSSEQQVHEATMKKARVSVQARTEAPMITDGCQWRKYGQKMAKGSPFPRAYYRCTMAAGCTVRKQVQRSADDRTILITTYEGKHNHPLPPAAMAMASTTSAAASMLLSGSMPSPDAALINPNMFAGSVLPCSSTLATISASAPFPTVTIDLTHTPITPLQFNKPQSIQFHIPQIFGQSLCTQSRFSGLQMPAVAAGDQNLQSLADSVSAAITADPKFTATLAAAIRSIVGGGGDGGARPVGSPETVNSDTELGSG